MHQRILATILVIGANTIGANADPLANCDTVKPAAQRMACLQKNIVSLEASLTQAQSDLKTQVAKVTALEAKLGATQADVGNALKNGDRVNIRSNVFTNKCLDQRSNPNPTPNPDEVRMVTCIPTDPADKWTLTR